MTRGKEQNALFIKSMNKSDEILKNLEKYIKETENNKSSHWKHYLNKNSNYKNIYSCLGFGSYTKKNYVNKFLHLLLQKFIFEKKIFYSKTYKDYKSLFDTINRQIDVDAIRHIFTFELLKNKTNPNSVCVIGDGKLNGLIGINLTFPNAKIYNCNLNETLINDYLILNDTNLSIKNSIKVVNSIYDVDDQDNKLILVSSHLKNFFI